ncbi:alpha/beta hydrolase [Sphingomonas sp. BIUV-7]|uniref:Alpha/beta hydrolase n=1 Tax=Sphingomonas natans TaxID=3063330 RepID=A0ABT8YAP7_9SPHN|nr:alpha/beta hydrolase [Sphingomonas sp. BIUV-7]MDO6415390.1 alpha/beta hydrolase [Sphingomonas sp. BIUV-7]
MRNLARFALAAFVLLIPVGSFAQSVPAGAIKTIVLVHGAFVDGSGWRPVYDRLVRDGYTVAIVQEPLTGLADDVGATKRVIDRSNGPVILVGHSYGGAIITEAGNDPKVAGLVYIAAHAPDEDETETENGRRFPAIGRTAIVETPDGYTIIDPARFHAEFAADLPKDEADYEAQAQGVTAAAVFTTPMTNPAWRNKPVWYMVAKADHIISPDLERMYAARARSRQTIEIEGASHSGYRSHPDEVADLIRLASREATARRIE